jgi:hypothetical protein
MDLALAHEGHHHPDQPQPGLRICSKECGAIAERSPDKYFAAAKADKVVD